MKKPLINAKDAPTRSASSGEHFSCSMTELAHPLGARSIGANITRVPPGKAAFPIHHHHARNTFMGPMQRVPIRSSRPRRRATRQRSVSTRARKGSWTWSSTRG